MLKKLKKQIKGTSNFQSSPLLFPTSKFIESAPVCTRLVQVLTSASDATAELRYQHILTCSLHADVGDARPHDVDTQSSTSARCRWKLFIHKEVGIHFGGMIFVNILWPNFGGSYPQHSFPLIWPLILFRIRLFPLKLLRYFIQTFIS